MSLPSEFFGTIQCEKTPQGAVDREAPKISSPVDRQNSVQSPFPFMRLPADVRLLVYSYLIPNTKVPLIDFSRKRRSKIQLRHDKTKCCPELLRVNRQIYHELFHEWYSHAEFKAELDGDFFWILDEEVIRETSTSCTSFPNTALSVKKMSLELPVFDWREAFHETSLLAIIHNYCDQLVLRAPENRLQCLHLEFYHFPVMLHYWLEYVLKFLKLYLDALRRLVRLVGICTAKMRFTSSSKAPVDIEMHMVAMKRDYEMINNNIEEGLGVKLDAAKFWDDFREWTEPSLSVWVERSLQ